MSGKYMVTLVWFPGAETMVHFKKSQPGCVALGGLYCFLYLISCSIDSLG